MTANSVLPAPEGFQQLKKQTGFEGLVGPFYYAKREDGLVFGLRLEPRHANPNGVVHGGLLMTLIDHTLGAAVWHAIERKPCATVSLNSEFLAAGKAGDWVEAHANISRRGRSLVFAKGQVRTGTRLLLTASGIWKVLEKPASPDLQE